MAFNFQKKSSASDDKQPILSAGFRVAVEKLIRKFIESGNEELCFPATLTRDDRNFIKQYCFKLGLFSKIKGKGEAMQVVVYKTTEAAIDASNEVIELKNRSFKIILKIQESLNGSAAESVQGEVEQKLPINLVSIGSVERHRNTLITVPPRNANPECHESRVALPIFKYRQQILDLVKTNKVVIVQSSTGSGKSTQIPQYILEECSYNELPARIIVAEPRRICATTLADRVSYERGEEIGTCVGYQIRLQSKVSPASNLIYVTNGVILRMLMGGRPEEFFRSITTLIIDEVHERDKFSDFLLLCVREFMHLNPSLRVIIMSATIDSNIFAEYFGNCPVIKLDGMSHEVREFFVEDILKYLKFTNGRVEDLRREYERDPQSLLKPAKVYGDGRHVKDEMKEVANEILDKMAASADCNIEFINFAYAVIADNIPVNFRHESTNKTALFFAIEYGFPEHVERLLNIKANPMELFDVEGVQMNCMEYTLKKNDPKIIEILANFLDLMNGPKKPESDVPETSTYDRMLLDIYYDTLLQPGVNRGTFLEDTVDLQLIARLIRELHFNTHRGLGILVFLPGHDEIVQLANLITNVLDVNYDIFILHSQMQTMDQINVFKPMCRGVRKIILATNIAESSITVNDIVYVIDSGKEKQKDFNAVTHVSSLRSQWISKASAQQRKGRAGRVCQGFVYRMYSKDRYNFLVDNPKPEFLRCEMTDLCLQAKMIAPPGDTIGSFLQKSITPPSELTIIHSVKILEDLGAFNPDETFTQLGLFLADIPLNAKYGKMLIFGIIFKCIDPILTIVSILSVNDPFLLFASVEDREKCHALKKKLEEGSYSDHFVLLRLFQKWNEYQSTHGFDGGFCEDNLVNSGTMQRIASTRVKIVGYLRSVRLIQSVGNISSLNTFSHSWSIIKFCLVAGSYPEVARVMKSKGTISVANDNKVIINPGSVLRANPSVKMTKDSIQRYPAEWMIFEHKTNAGTHPMIKTCTVVTSLCLVLAGGLRITTDFAEDTSSVDEDDSVESMVEMEIDKFVKFSASALVAISLQDLREQLTALVDKFLRNVDSYRLTETDQLLIDGLVKLLEAEDEKAGFKIKYYGIGNRPRIITRDGRDVDIAREPVVLSRVEQVREVSSNVPQPKNIETKKKIEEPKKEEIIKPEAAEIEIENPPDELEVEEPADLLEAQVPADSLEDPPVEEVVGDYPAQLVENVDKIKDELKEMKLVDIGSGDAPEPTEGQIDDIIEKQEEENIPEEEVETTAETDNAVEDNVESQEEVIKLAAAPQLHKKKNKPVGVFRYFMAELQSRELAKDLHRKTYPFMLGDANLPTAFIDTIMEAEINDRVSKKAMVFYSGKEIVGASMLLGMHGESTSRDNIQMFFRSFKTFDVSEIKPMLKVKKFKQIFNGVGYAEIPKDVGRFCVDICIDESIN